MVKPGDRVTIGNIVGTVIEDAESDRIVVKCDDGGYMTFPLENKLRLLDEDTPIEQGVPESEDTTVSAEQPVAAPIGGGDSVNDGLGESVSSSTPVEGSGTESEDTAVSSEDPVAATGSEGSDSNDGSV